MVIRNHLVGRIAISLPILFRGREIAWVKVKGFGTPAGLVKAVAK